MWDGCQACLVQKPLQGGSPDAVLYVVSSVTPTEDGACACLLGCRIGDGMWSKETLLKDSSVVMQGSTGSACLVWTPPC